MISFSLINIEARWGRLECVRLLLIAGADVAATDTNMLTALHDASRNGHLECVQELVRHGCD